MTDVIVIRPQSDSVEKTLSLWVDLLLPPGTGLPGVNVVDDLAGTTAATATAAQSKCSAGDVILFFGHGTEQTLGIPTLLDIGSINGAANRVVIAIACLSSDDLGPKAVSTYGLVNYLGFSEPLFVYNASPGLFGFQVSNRVGSYLTGTSPLAQVKNDIEADFKSIEALYHTGAMSTDPDAMLIWMGARMNWRGLALH
jgi:hypothetical protein